MAAYVIADVEVLDPARYEDYKKMVPATIAAHGGRFVARGGTVEVLEGDWDPHRVVIVEFPSLEHARAWWSSADYRPARDLRQATSRGRLIVVDGV